MRCNFVTVPGGFAVVCGGRGKPKFCACGAVAGLLCDFPLQGGGTCSKALCAKCTTRVSAGVDWCGGHARWWSGLAALLGVPA